MINSFRNGHLFDLIKRHKDSEAEAKAKRSAKKLQNDYDGGQTSGIHDTGGMANIRELTEGGMLDPAGLFVGLDETSENFLFSCGKGSKATIGAPRIGKGATVVQPNLGHLGNEYSIVCVDIGAENARVSKRYRRDVLGQKVFEYNPSGLYGAKGVRLDPLTHIRKAGEDGNFPKVATMSGQFARVQIPEKESAKGDGSWVDSAARFEIETRLVFAALECPQLCSMPAMYDFLSLPPQEQVEFMLLNSRSDYVLTRIRQMEADIQTGAEKQLHWKLERAAQAFEIYQKDTELGLAQRGEALDVTCLKREPCTLYLQYAESSLKAHGRDIVAQITSIVEQLAETDGPQKILFLIDECSQLPPMDLPVWIRSLGKRNIQFWTFWQSVASIEAVYGKAGAADILATCDLKQYLSIDDVIQARRLIINKPRAVTGFPHRKRAAVNLPA